VSPFSDDDVIFFINVQAGLTVKGQHDVGCPFGKAEFDMNMFGHHQGPVGESKGADGGHDDARYRGMNHRPAGG